MERKFTGAPKFRPPDFGAKWTRRRIDPLQLSFLTRLARNPNLSDFLRQRGGEGVGPEQITAVQCAPKFPAHLVFPKCERCEFQPLMRPGLWGPAAVNFSLLQILFIAATEGHRRPDLPSKLRLIPFIAATRFRAAPGGLGERAAPIFDRKTGLDGSVRGADSNARRNELRARKRRDTGRFLDRSEGVHCTSPGSMHAESFAEGPRATCYPVAGIAPCLLARVHARPSR
jgi:hypothetical protein